MIEAIQAEYNSGGDSHYVLSAVDKMRKHILCIVVTPDTLQSTPNGRQSIEEALKPGVARVTHTRLVPFVGIQTEEHGNVLDPISRLSGSLRLMKGITYSCRVGQRAPDIAEEEVSELDRIQTCQQQAILFKCQYDESLKGDEFREVTYVRIQEPSSGSMVKYRCREEQYQQRQAY